MIGVYQQKGLDLFSQVATTLSEELNLEAFDAGFFTISPAAYDATRKQYDSKMILKYLTEKKSQRFDYRLGLIDVDIFAPAMNFIFGLADPIRKACLVSIYRLAGKAINERIAKEIVHEMGHLLGLDHCQDASCVMYFSNTIIDTDHKDKKLCAICRRKVG